MRIIVSDSNCLIDLRKASLLEAFLTLPYEILIPNTLFEELLKFLDEEKKELVRFGLKVVDLLGEAVLRAREVTINLPHLFIHDGLAFALAESCPGCIFLTADRRLWEFAVHHEMEVHGVLWVIDQIHTNGLATARDLLVLLRQFERDRTARLPRRDLAAHFRKRRVKHE